MTYDLRRLRTHGLIERIAHTHRYQVTDHGLHTAMFLTGLPQLVGIFGVCGGYLAWSGA